MGIVYIEVVKVDRLFFLFGGGLMGSILHVESDICFLRCKFIQIHLFLRCFFLVPSGGVCSSGGF